MPKTFATIPSLFYGTAFLQGALLFLGGTNLSLFEIGAVAIFCATGMYTLFKTTKLSFLKEKPVLTLILFGLLVLVQAFFSADGDTLFAVTTLYLMSIALIIRYWAHEIRSLSSILLKGYTLGALLASCVGLGAYVTALAFHTTAHLPYFWPDKTRLIVFFDDPVVYGAFLVAPLMYLATRAMYEKVHTQKYVVFLYGAVLLLFTNLILTGSRGAWLNLLVASSVFFLLYSPSHTRELWYRMTTLLIPCIVIGILIIFVIPLNGRTYYEATLRDRHQSSDMPRLHNLTSAPDKLFNRNITETLFGSGSGSYEKTTPSGFSAHNTYLRIMYEQGMMGLSLYGCLFFIVLMSLWKRRISEPYTSALLFSLCIGILVQGMFVDTLHWRHVWVMIGVLL